MSIEKLPFIHEKADVQTDSIGNGTLVWQYSIILKQAKIGKNSNINAHVFIENDVIVGDNVTVKCGVQLWDGTTVEDNVFIGPNVTFTNDKYPRSKIYPDEFLKTLIKKGASIGANATILSGLTIGENAMIGAGSVVTKDVPPGELWFGNPAIKKGVAPQRSATPRNFSVKALISGLNIDLQQS
jgi:UDP-2-acetamido-3-amino-2,3-dideoxy-glucuronate N-acetyltransferase